MTELVRVKGPDGAEFTTSRRAAKVFGAKVLEDKAAVDANGRPLPEKPNIHKGGTLPVKSSSRADLEAYAVDHGGMTAEDAAGFPNKDELYAALEASQDTTTDDSQEG